MDNSVNNVPLETALLEGNNTRQSAIDAYSRGVDGRSGSNQIRDAAGNSITVGDLGDGNLGISVKDSSGFVLFKLLGTTWLWYDKTNNANVMQVGLLPDGTYGFAIAKNGISVASAYS